MINFVSSSQSRLCTQTAKRLPAQRHQSLCTTPAQEKEEAKEKVGQYLGPKNFLALKGWAPELSLPSKTGAMFSYRTEFGETCVHLGDVLAQCHMKFLD